MTTSKLEYQSLDAAPAVLYAKTDADSITAYPITQAMLNPGFALPKYDRIVLGYSGSTLTSVVYYLGSPSVATMTLSYTGSNLTVIQKV